MKTVLLAGGRGVRLRPLTYSIPKPLLPVGERPILELIIERLKAFGLRDLVIAVGYRAELIETYFRDGSHLDVRIEYVREAEPLGTAGPLTLVRDQCGIGQDDSLLVMNGDLLTDLDMREVIEFHERGSHDLTVVTREYQLEHPYGVIQRDGTRITSIVEKPTVVDTVSAGVYVLRSSMLDLVPSGTVSDIPELMNKAIAAGHDVAAYPFDGGWLAIDRMEELADAVRFVAESPA
ncbi:MAG: sugar phosphate nucleotidyltransferase [Acidimicrobiia bacterium]